MAVALGCCLRAADRNKNWPDILPSLSDQSQYINDTHIRELPVNFPDNRQSLLPKTFEGVCLGTCLS